MLIDAGMVQMVKGPATVHVIGGRCRVLGMDLPLGHTVQVRAGKALPFEPDNNYYYNSCCNLDVQGGESWTADPRVAGTSMWEKIAGAILSPLPPLLPLSHHTVPVPTMVVMVVGATDTGKSTFSTYLANLALGRSIETCVIDGDIGQGDLAPPAALAAAVLKEQIVDLRDARASLFEFVGAITPAYVEKLVAQKLNSLVCRRTNGAIAARLKIVNTDGYMEPSYKRMLAGAVSPDVIVYLGQDDRNNDLASELSGRWKLVVAQPSAQALKTHSDRVGRRMEQYARYVGTRLVFKRRNVGATRFLYRNRPIQWEYLHKLRPEGMFVALGSRRRISGFGVIEFMDERQVSIRTDMEDFTTIHASEVRLRGNCHEERISISADSFII
ncbi:MAG TPA: Clp1/GlmU family protein [Nitrososphaera sp.]|nr:Clp1/GlmU family protein [Nitrososphaera sp.]